MGYGFFDDEIAATEQIRKEFPSVGQRTLARDIRDQAAYLEAQVPRQALLSASIAPYATIYNRIRRFDASTKAGPHARALKRLNLSPGDRVRVERAVPSYHGGWKDAWVKPDMTEMVGRTYRVVIVDGPAGVVLERDDRHRCDYAFPAHVLTVVKRAADIPALV